MNSNHEKGGGARTSGAYRYRFTVFTPTFNRADTLSRVYDSLSAQTFDDFEWLIIDDGSTDGTRKLVTSWQDGSTFPIRYLHQPNAGKHLAHNWAVEEALGELFLVLDSDDACVPDALERFVFHWESIPADQRERFSAVTALCMNPDGQLVGDRFPQDVLDSDALELIYRYRVRGEKWGVHRTDVLRRFPFPLRPRLYIPEGVVWNAIAREYQTRYVNEMLRIYFVGATGRDDQLIRRIPSGERAAGHALQHESALNQEINWFGAIPGAFFRSAIHYTRFSFLGHQGVAAQGGRLTNPLARLLWALMLPLGWVSYRIDLRRMAHIRRSGPPSYKHGEE